jgi:hypothetical protein
MLTCRKTPLASLTGARAHVLSRFPTSASACMKSSKLTNVNPCVLGRTVCRDGFSFGGSGSSRYAWKLKVPACIDCVTLGFLLDLTPVTLTATLTVPSLVLSMPSTTSRLTPPCQFATNRPHKALGWPREKPRWQRSRPQPQKAKLR